MLRIFAVGIFPFACVIGFILCLAGATGGSGSALSLDIGILIVGLFNIALLIVITNMARDIATVRRISEKKLKDKLK
ncbi:MAG: hypothetical protein FWF98_04730 [Dehalococcoidia bacterium]|nr:hypothetical protein [Dehalococcoidia bacterium]